MGSLVVFIGIAVVVQLVSSWIKSQNQVRDVYDDDSETPPKKTLPDLVPWMHRQRLLGELTSSGEQEYHLATLGSSWGGVVAQQQAKGPIPIPDSVAVQVGESPEALWRSTIESFVARPFPFDRLEDGFVVVREGDGLDPARVWCIERIKRLGFGGNPIAIAPNANLLLLADGANERALRRLLVEAEAAWEHPEWRTLEALELVDGEWEDYLPPPRHPLAAAFRAARAKSLAREFADVMPRVEDAGGPTAARVAALPESAGGELVATWVKGTMVMLPPQCDRVVLIDPEASGEDRRVELTWHAFEGCFDWMLEDMNVANRTRLGAFPTVYERSFARRAQASFDPSYDVEFLPPATRADFERAHREKGGTLLHAEGARLSDGRDLPLEGDELIALAKEISEEDFKHVSISVLATRVMDALVGAAEEAGEEEDGEEEGGEDEEEAGPDTGEGEDENPEQRAMKNAVGLISGSFSAEDRGRLMLVLRPEGYREATRVATRAMLAANGHGVMSVLEQEPLAWPLASGIEVELVLDHGNRMIPINSAMAAGGYSEELKKAAMANLEGASVLPLRELVPGASQAEWTDGFRASRLLLPGLVDATKYRGGPVAFTPTYDSFIVAALEDPAALEAAISAAEGMVVQVQYAFREAMTAQPWRLENGAWTPWTLPSSHPLAARVAALQRRLEQQRRDAVSALAQVVPQQMDGTQPPARA